MEISLISKSVFFKYIVYNINEQSPCWNMSSWQNRFKTVASDYK